MNVENQAKILTIVGVAPVLADYIEDLIDEGEVKYEMKRLLKNIMTAIRHADETITKGFDAHSCEQQVNIQRAFRNWQKQAFNLDEQ